MSKASNGPSSLSEAIEKLESAGQEKAQDFKQVLEKDYKEVRKALDELKPYLDELRQNVSDEFKARKNQVEGKVKESPWLALGVVGLFALIIGLLFGNRRRD